MKQVLFTKEGVIVIASFPRYMQGGNLMWRNRPEAAGFIAASHLWGMQNLKISGTE